MQSAWVASLLPPEILPWQLARQHRQGLPLLLLLLGGGFCLSTTLSGSLGGRFLLLLPLWPKALKENTANTAPIRTAIKIRFSSLITASRLLASYSIHASGRGGELRCPVFQQDRCQ